MPVKSRTQLARQMLILILENENVAVGFFPFRSKMHGRLGWESGVFNVDIIGRSVVWLRLFFVMSNRRDRNRLTFFFWGGNHRHVALGIGAECRTDSKRLGDVNWCFYR